MNLHRITPVFWAAKTDDEALLNFLLDRGAGVNDRIKNDETLLHHAVLRGHRQIVGLLLEKGAHVNCAGNKGQTPLHWAVFRGDVDIVDLLLSAGAETEAKNCRVRTAADWAALKDRADLVQLLASRGAKAPTAAMPSPATKRTRAPRRSIPVGDAVLGRMLDAAGNPLDGKGKLADAVGQPV